MFKTQIITHAAYNWAQHILGYIKTLAHLHRQHAKDCFKGKTLQIF